MGLVQLAIVKGLELDYRPADLNEMLVNGAEEHRSGGAWTTVSRVYSEMEEVRLVRIDGGFARAAEGEEADATLSIGPSNLGGFVRFAAGSERTPTGISIAPRRGLLRLRRQRAGDWDRPARAGARTRLGLKASLKSGAAGRG